MKKKLLSSAAMAGAGLVAGHAWAEEPIRLAIGGHFKEAYMIAIDDNDFGEPGHDRNTDGFFNDAEVHFIGTTVLDNGLEVGAQIEVEGETSGDPVDEAYVWFAGGFGEIRVGSDDDALHKACVVPPGGSANFSAFSPNQWASNDDEALAGFGVPDDNSICTGVDDDTDAQKIIYTSPVFAGFQLTASYTPQGDVENHTDGGGPHVGMPSHFPGQSRHNAAVAVNYGYDGETWGMAASLGASFEGHVEEGIDFIDLDVREQDFYQAGINFYFGNFAIGIGGEYYHDLLDVTQSVGPDSIRTKADAWVAGIGASYSHDAWILGLQYAHLDHEAEIDASDGLGVPFGELDSSRDRVVGTLTYLLGPGISLDAEVGYTWTQSDADADELDLFGDVSEYEALELGMGALITF
jgi:outer membrane protein OmpU